MALYRSVSRLTRGRPDVARRMSASRLLRVRCGELFRAGRVRFAQMPISHPEGRVPQLDDVRRMYRWECIEQPSLGVRDLVLVGEEDDLADVSSLGELSLGFRYLGQGERAADLWPDVPSARQLDQPPEMNPGVLSLDPPVELRS